MTGEMVHAERALSLGFLSEVVDAELLNTRVNEVAEMMLGNAPIGLSKAKQIIAAVSSGPVGDAMIDYTAKFITDIRDSDEGREGLSAFLEKRKPNW